MEDASTPTPDAPETAAPETAAAGTAAGSVAVDKPVPLRVSDNALAQVMGILAAEDDPESLALRVGVTGTRGVEYAYDLSFEERSTAEDDDLIYEQGELTVMIPADSVDPLWGATLDLPSSPGQGGLVIRNPNRPDPLAAADIELSGTVSERVNQLLEQSINPALASHGGFAKLEEIVGDTKAVVTMGGGCQGCAVSAMTLRDGIQKSILEHIPEITEVVDATDHAAGETPYYTE
ncbi:MAG: nfuA [Acidimicrobiales bacterium]|nr:nfuA [Acidimicrobiales bacterium]